MRILILGESGECLAFMQKRTNSYRGEIKCFSLVYNFVPREVGAYLKARINSIGKARENSIVEKDVKKIKKC